jgi:hypothetical protein
VCEPVTLLSAGLSAAGQVAQHNAEGEAVEGRNRAKLKNFDRENQQYLDDIRFDNIQYENDMIESEIAHDQNYQEMVDQWTEQDMHLNSLFREADLNMEEAVIDMYESDYAGTQTGKTAMRLAGDSVRKYGQYKSRILGDLMFAKTETFAKKEAIQRGAQRDAYDIFNQVRFAPAVGPTPQAPELEAKPSSAGLILGLAGTAVQGIKDYKSFKAEKVGSGKGKHTKSISSHTARDSYSKSERISQRTRNYEGFR